MMAISDLQEPPMLVYRVDFTSSSPTPPAMPSVNTIDKDLFVATSGGSGQNPQPGPGSLADAIINTPSILQADGLHLAITHTSDRTDLLCTLGPIPRWLRRFRVSADFVPDGSAGDLDPAFDWAVSVFVRDGNLTSTLNAKVVGATQQLVGSSVVYVTLGAGSNATHTSPKASSTQVPEGSVYDTTGSAFTLAAYVDCDSGTGQGQLTTATGYHWENSWTHPFVGAGPHLPLKDVVYVGFGIAFRQTGSGTARAIVQRFTVLHWPESIPTH